MFVIFPAEAQDQIGANIQGLQNGCKKWLGFFFFNLGNIMPRWWLGGGGSEGGIFLYVYLLFNLLSTGPNWNKLAGFAGWIQEIVFGLTNLRNSLWAVQTTRSN